MKMKVSTVIGMDRNVEISFCQINRGKKITWSNRIKDRMESVHFKMVLLYVTVKGLEV